METLNSGNTPAIEQRLHKSDLDRNPFEQFRAWFADAAKLEGRDVTAMTLATADAQGRPSARVVLLKTFDENGFVFFTNYKSRKSRDLDSNPQAMLLFWWEELARQIRIAGKVSRVSDAESDAYFKSRPRGSQLGAWASPQSEIIASRELLEERLAEVERRFGNGAVERPPHWGGFRLVPDSFEFWHGGNFRLHDRFLYTRTGDGWRLDRLGP